MPTTQHLIPALLDALGFSSTENLMPFAYWEARTESAEEPACAAAARDGDPEGEDQRTKVSIDFWGEAIPTILLRM